MAEQEQLEIVFEEETPEEVVAPPTPEPEEEGVTKEDLEAQLRESLETQSALAEKINDLTMRLGSVQSEAQIGRAIRDAIGAQNKAEPLSEREAAVKAVIDRIYPGIDQTNLTKQAIGTISEVLKTHIESVRAERSAQASDLAEDLMEAAGMDTKNKATVQFVEQGIVAQISADPELKSLFQSGRVQKAVRAGFKKFSESLPGVVGKAAQARVAGKVAAVKGSTTGPKATGGGTVGSAAPARTVVKIDPKTIHTSKGRDAMHDAGFQLLQSLLGKDDEG